jgi:hypothetical protein
VMTGYAPHKSYPMRKILVLNILIGLAISIGIAAWTLRRFHEWPF